MSFASDAYEEIYSGDLTSAATRRCTGGWTWPGGCSTPKRCTVVDSERWVLVVDLADLADDGERSVSRVYGPWRSQNRANAAQARLQRAVDELTADQPREISVTARVVRLRAEDNGTDQSLFGLIRRLREATSAGGHRG